VFGAVLRLRNRYYDRPSAVRRARIPVISVGNLTVGGTGKTPIVAWLARRLTEAGRRPAVVSRGYGGRAGRGPRVVSRGSGPDCAADECGDEPYLLASTLPGVAVVVGHDRPAGADAAADLGRDVVLLDDGFQHRRLARDLDIVLLDAAKPFGNGRLLPAGSLREPPSALARAGLVLVTRSGPGAVPVEIERVVRSFHRDVPILRAGHRRVGFFDGDGRRVESPRRAVLFCGIGSPEVFRRDVEADGVEVVAFEPGRDHRRYDAADLARLSARAASLGAVLITTEKDRVRLPGKLAEREARALLTLRIEAEPHDAERLLEAVQRALAAHGEA
jgi:tetraacyldisaccharide 4'-kinase